MFVSEAKGGMVSSQDMPAVAPRRPCLLLDCAMHHAKRRKSVRAAAPQSAPDPVNPPALLEFMMRDWRPAPRRSVAAIAGAARFRARRKALSRAFLGQTLVIPSGHEKVRVNDTTYRFRPGSDFYYLTGNKEPDCVLVLWPNKSGGHEHVLYVEPNPGRTDPTFFTDRAKGELWVGPRLGVEETKRRFGVDRCAPLAELAKRLARRGAPVCRLLRGVDPLLDARFAKQGLRDQELATSLSEQRLIKDATEVAAIAKAAVATRAAFDAVVRELHGAKNERQLEATFDRQARLLGNEVGYGTIAAAGADACTLHWTRNDRPLDGRSLVLIDAGVEGEDLYTADITRTLPQSGVFSAEQRALYELVVSAQEAALAAVKPGADFQAPHRASIETLTRGLERLGILPMSAAEALAADKQFHKRYTLHNTSHMLGLDVHDNAAARPEHYRQGKLRVGMVLTVEPGLYLQSDDLTVPARYRGIGIRLEDDVLVTKSGYRLLTDVPRTVADIETWMRNLWRERGVAG